MLSADQIADSMEADWEGGGRITVTPCPDLQSCRDRGSTSVDLRLGRWFKTFKQTRHSEIDLGPNARSLERSIRSREHFVPFGSSFTLHPGRFALGVTLEWIAIPKAIAGHITGKSSLGRHGLVIETASGIHPRFNGCLTLELSNVGEVPLLIYPGMEICQVSFFSVIPSRSGHGGSFSGSRKPTVSAPRTDDVLSRLTEPP